MTLKELQIGKSAVITKVGGEGALRQHFLDMGMIPGAEVTVVKLAPMGDPMEVQIHGYELTLRLAEAEEIEIEQIQKRTRDIGELNRVRIPIILDSVRVENIIPGIMRIRFRKGRY